MFFRIKKYQNIPKALIYAGLRLQYQSHYYEINKKQYQKFIKSLFCLTKKEKDILMRNILNKTPLS